MKSHAQGHVTGKWQICVCCSLGFSSLHFKTSLMSMPSSVSDLPSVTAFLWRLPLGKCVLMCVYINILVYISLWAWALDPVPGLIKSSLWACKAEGQTLELLEQQTSACKGCAGRLEARVFSGPQAGAVLKSKILTSPMYIHVSPFSFPSSAISACFFFPLALTSFSLFHLFHSLAPPFSLLSPKFASFIFPLFLLEASSPLASPFTTSGAFSEFILADVTGSVVHSC